MTTQASQLADRLDAALDASVDVTAQRWLWRSLLHLLATGAPASPEDIATVTGRPLEEVCAALAALPSIELDDHGHVVGCGITLRPTPHRFQVDGRTLIYLVRAGHSHVPHRPEPARVDRLTLSCHG